MQKRRFTKEFKQQAAKLVLEQGMRNMDVAKDLGVSHSLISTWVNQYKKNGGEAFPGKGKLLPWDEEKRQLETQVRRLTIERDILKKTIGYLADKP
jgi:transposase-like protein